MKVLDVFSGIGGLSWMLCYGTNKHKTVAFCEKDTLCRDILMKNMRMGRLSNAPVYPDVHDLTGNVLQALAPDILLAGFPCQDISVANIQGKGVGGGERSSLFYELMRIVDECSSIKVLFLENSANILNRGVNKVLHALGARGFKVVHCVHSAKHVGAPHVRRRWFAMAIRNMNREDVTLNLCNIDFRHLEYDWSNEPVFRVLPLLEETKPLCLARCMALGNSLVPQCACKAWDITVSAFIKSHNICTSMQPTTKGWKGGLITPNKCKRMYFPTPTYTTWHEYRRVTDRGLYAIGNFIYKEKKTVEQVKALKAAGRIRKSPKDLNHLDGVVMLNPVFIEWLMGFPLEWTLQQ